MASRRAVPVCVRELKNRLTSYLKLAKADREVIVTERGRPIAVIGSIGRVSAGSSLEARIAALAVKGEIQAPERPLRPHIHRVKVAGGLLSEQIIADRAGRLHCVLSAADRISPASCCPSDPDTLLR